MAGFDRESVVVRGQSGIHGRTPLPFNGNTGSVAAKAARPSYGIDAAGQASGRNRERQAGEENLILAMQRSDRDPGIRRTVKAGRRASGGG